MSHNSEQDQSRIHPDVQDFAVDLNAGLIDTGLRYQPKTQTGLTPCNFTKQFVGNT